MIRKRKKTDGDLAVGRFHVLALFDDGSQSVKNALKDDDVLSVGLNNADVILDLADFNNISTLVKRHNEKPFDLIFACPPCESWSFATASRGGNAYRFSDSLKLKNFHEWQENTYNNVKMIVEKDKSKLTYFQRYYQTGVNGEFTALFTAELIKQLNIPFVVENPYSSMIWDYLTMHGLEFVKNKACYCEYDKARSLKPTGFATLKPLNLKTAKKATITQKQLKGRGDGSIRAAIPAKLIVDIVEQLELARG